MQNTTNLNLKKPEYTDFADIQDINDNMDILDGALHDTQNSVATFASSDTADGSASSWTTVPALASGETHKSLFAKMSQMFKNVRYLYKLLGTTDISSIGDGTVTKALSVLNAKYFFMSVETNSITVGAGARVSTSVDVSLDGYVPVGIIGVFVKSTEVIIPVKWAVNNTNRKVDLTLFNSYTESRSSVISLAILYQKTL